MKIITLAVLATALLLIALLVPFSPLSAYETTVVERVLLTAQSVDETSAVIAGAEMRRCRQTAIYVDWGTGVSAGVVQLESAYSDTYAGTWAPIQTVTYASGSPKSDIVQITGIHRALRARISTVISGGTVTVSALCN